MLGLGVRVSRAHHSILTFMQYVLTSVIVYKHRGKNIFCKFFRHGKSFKRVFYTRKQQDKLEYVKLPESVQKILCKKLQQR